MNQQETMTLCVFRKSLMKIWN
ncbi:hypothetical protein HID58_024980 [Brassica napus]|uniref:Uncharacterized protein n=1 Tax=Brassica napus TaxID=3708 RepID=A0ABQ8CLN1_BRANA|nr:hypothetical protein HID58_024980 [Brassica napus]